ncbi:hypothetical protein OS187_03595 [Xanthomonadaceae bacterium JHOS43]|nr:hypothetical protein [Xanthomonadaceae bacterium JHOS43]
MASICARSSNTILASARQSIRLRPRQLLCLAIAGLCGLAVASPRPQGDPLPDEIFRDNMEEYVVLSGQARFLDPMAGAQVTLSGSDGRQIVVEADEDGRFDLSLELLSAQTVYQLRARGTGAQAHEEYASWLGQRDFLLERAGADRTATEADLPALRLNPYQTGLYVAMRDLATSPLSPTEREFERRARSFSAVDFQTRAILIAMLASGDLALPEGAATTLAAMSNESLALQAQLALEADTRPCPENPYCVAIDRVMRDPDQLPLMPAPHGVTVHPYLTHSVGLAITQPRFRLEAGGTGTFGASNSASNDGLVPAIWTDEGEYVRVTPADGSAFDEWNFFANIPSCGCQVPAIQRTVAYRLMFADGPAGTLLVGSSSEVVTHYPENPELPDQVLTATPGIGYASVVDDVGLTSLPAPAGKTFILPTCQLPDCSAWVTSNLFHSNQSVVNEPHQFAANGTGTATRLGLSFTWELDGDILTLDYSNGTHSALTIASADRLYGTTTGIFTDTDGREIPFSRMYAPRQAGAQFHSGNVVGASFQSQIAIDHPYSILSSTSPDRPGMIPTRFKFNPAGSGEYPSNPAITLTWSIDEVGRLRFLLDRSGFPPNSLYPQRRTWELVAEDAGSILVLETVEVPELVGGVYQPLPPAGTVPPTSRFFRYTRR